jgi:RNA polymerase sigma-70 factor, ECF subfamily
MNSDDKKIIEESKEDPKAYEEIYDKYSDKVFNYFWYRTGHDKDLSEDLMQETFLRAFSNRMKFKYKGFSYLTYLLTIAHNILVDHYRKPESVPIETLKDVPVEIIEDQVRKSDAEALWRAIQELPQQNRDVLMMKYQDGMPIKDVAEVMDKTPNSIKLMLSRTRKKLAEHPYIKDIRGFKPTNKIHTKARFLD